MVVASKQNWTLRTDLLVLAVLVALALSLSAYNHLMFHFTVELFRLVVGFTAFTIVWNIRRHVEDRFLLLYCMVLGPTSAIALLHTLSYQEIEVLSGPADLSLQFWVAEHLVGAGGVLAASYLSSRKVSAFHVLAVEALTALALIAAIITGVFPSCVAEGGGVTPFKVAAEVVIVSAFALALARYLGRGDGHPTLRRFIIIAMVAAILREVALTSSSDTMGVANLAGHLFTLVAAYMIFSGVVRTGLAEPHEAFYRSLALTNARLADEALYSRAMADLALEAGASDIWQWNLETGAVEFSPHFYSSLGYRREDLPKTIDRLMAVLVHPGDLPLLRRSVTGFRSGAVERQELEIRVRTKAGEWRWMMSRGRSVKFDEDGRPLTVLGTNVDITERKVVEQALRSSEERFRAIFNSVDDFIFIHDGETGAILDCNDRACELYGYSRSEMLSLNVGALSSGLLPFTQEEAMVWMLAAVDGGPRHLEWHARDRSGRLFWVEIRVRGATIGAQNLLLITGRDITERRKAAEALEWDAKVGSTFADLAKQLLMPKSGEEIAERIGDAGLALTGSKAALVAPYDQDLGIAITRRMCGAISPTRCPIANEVLVFGRAGMRNETACPNAPDGGCGRYMVAPAMVGDRLIGVVAVAGRADDYDPAHMSIVGRLADHYAMFLQRTEAEAQLLDSEDRFRSMTRAANDGVIVLDDGGKVAFWNPAAERMFGYDADEIVGQELHPLIMPDPNDQTYRTNFHLFASSGEGPVLNKTIELVARRKDGRTFPVELSVAPFRIGRRWNAVGIVRDISERKEMQQQLTQLQKMEALGNLAGGIAHDFNNLILPITMFTEMAIEDIPAGSPTVEMLRKVLGAGERAKELVTKILAFSRKAETERVRGSLLAAVQEAMELVRATVPASIDVRTELADVGDALFDRSQIQTILLNLVSNSVDAIDGGTGWITVGLSHVHATDALASGVLNLVVGREYALVRVKDSGCGMPPEVVERMFDPFFTTKPVGHGTGLGMPMVHSIVRNHGGALRVHSMVGKGTTIEIYLPLEC